MLCFFTMGFVDMLGIAKNHLVDDQLVSNSTAYMLASLVFFWFFIFSIPTSLLMNRIGRKRTGGDAENEEPEEYQRGKHIGC